MDAKSINVRCVTANCVVDLRGRLLRPGKPRSDSIYATDAHPRTVHFGVIASDGGPIVACGTFSQEPFAEEPAWRLRGMAVDPTQQGRGLGRALLNAAEGVLIEVDPSIHLLWANARVSAIGFYERMNWRIVGEPFEADGLPHVKMIKQISVAPLHANANDPSSGPSR